MKTIPKANNEVDPYLEAVLRPGNTAREAVEAYYRYLQQPAPPTLRCRSQNKSGKATREPAEILLNVMNGASNAKDGKPRMDAAIDACMIDAARGDLVAAEVLIDMYHHSKKNGDFAPDYDTRYVDLPERER